MGGLGVAFGPVGVAIGVVTGLSFLGYQFFKSQDKSQNSFYIERADSCGTGGRDPKDPKDDEKKRDENPIIIRGKGQAPKNGPPNSIYEKIDNENPNLVVSRTTYNKFGKEAAREDYYVGNDPHTHFDKETRVEFESHKHIFEYNDRGQLVGRPKVVPLNE